MMSGAAEKIRRMDGKRDRPRGITGPQAKYLAKLCKLAGVPWVEGLSCVEASARIDELRVRLGFDRK